MAGFKLFGFTIKREEDSSSDIKTFVKPDAAEDLGVAELVTPNSFTGIYNPADSATSIDYSENSYINQYRDIAMYPEVDTAIEEIVTEAIITDENQDSVKLDLSEINYPEPVKEKIRASFKKVLRLLNFRVKGHDIFRRWYIDGRINYHVIIDENDTKKGIVELRYIDPKKIKKIRQLVKSKNQQAATAKIIEYYLFDENGVDNRTVQTATATRISKDSIAHANSGLTDPKNTFVISHLHKAIAPANKLRTLENSMVIYRLVRAPERRMIYVDIGNLSRGRAEQYMKSVMQRYKTKITYDTISGKIRDDRNIMSLTEDIWIPRQNSSKSTEITTLPGITGNTGVVDETEYMKKNLLTALNVPYSRLDTNSTFNIGNSGEMSRDEARFAKFITRLRTRFNDLFDELLSKELVLTRVISIEDWEKIRQDIHYDYLKDNYFTELLQADMLSSRIGVLTQVEPYIGKFYSNEYVMKNILMMTDEEIEEIQAQIKKEQTQDLEAHTLANTTHTVDLQNKLATVPDYSDDIGKPNPFKQ